MASSTSTDGQEKGSQDLIEKKGGDHTEEIAAIKSAFAGRCRVINDSGEYKHIVTIQPDNYDITIKFQLRASYPSEIPDIAVRSSSLSHEHSMDLRNSLVVKAQEMTGKPMIHHIMQLAQEKLPGCGLKPGKAGHVESHTIISDDGKRKEKKKKQKKKRTPKSEDEVEEEKKKKMKTALDVIKRIKWDESLDQDDFLVGYIDRFRGLLEKYFTAFTWEDLASVDYDVLAIPQHTIQYFKYKTIKVWDRPHRIDNVFGSAMGTKTIDVAIKEYEELEQKKKSKESEQERESLTEDSDTDSEESDSDDDIVVTIGGSANSGVTLDGAQAPIRDDDADKEDTYNPYWRDKLRPNYFVCVRITDPGILDHTAEVQDHLMEKEPLFGECCIPGLALHVTLCTLGLDTPEQLINCMKSLEKMKDELRSVLPKSLLRLHGASHFYNRVVYAKVIHGEDFIKFCDALKLNLRADGIEIRDGYEFVPHMTIIKTTRPISKLRGSKNIDPSMYEKFLKMRFGEQKIDKISLCSMSKERREDGFYLTPMEITFD